MTEPKLFLNLGRIVENYKLLGAAVGRYVAPVVKCDAYGLGAVDIVGALSQNGSEKFYVSTADEAVALNKVYKGIQIYVLNGPGQSDISAFSNKNIHPVINNIAQLDLYESLNKKSGDAVVNLETGFNRLGVRPGDWNKLTPTRLDKNNIRMMMTHFDDDASAITKRQFARFGNATEIFSDMKFSSNLVPFITSGKRLPVLEVRAGQDIYGLASYPKNIPVKPVISVRAPVVAVETVDAGETVGYSATYKAAEKRKIAVVGIGYSHGVPTSLANVGRIKFGDYFAPIVGAISMGLTTCDVSDIPDSALRTKVATVLDDDYDLVAMSKDAKRSYCEMMTMLKLEKTIN